MCLTQVVPLQDTILSSVRSSLHTLVPDIFPGYLKSRTGAAGAAAKLVFCAAASTVSICTGEASLLHDDQTKVTYLFTSRRLTSYQHTPLLFLPGNFETRIQFCTLGSSKRCKDFNLSKKNFSFGSFALHCKCITRIACGLRV